MSALCTYAVVVLVAICKHGLEFSESESRRGWSCSERERERESLILYNGAMHGFLKDSAWFTRT